MIDSRLKKDLPKAYGLLRSNVQLSYFQKNGTFELKDNVACKRCKSRFANRNNCNETVTKVNAPHHSITVVDHENYINQFNGTDFGKGETCDFMLFDTNNSKVIFCELGCYSEKHIEKKQNKSRQQLRNSLERFLGQNCGKTFLEQFSENY